MRSVGYMPPAQSSEWETPNDLFDQLWEEFGGFDLDPCARYHHYTAKKVLTHGGLIYVPRDERGGRIYRDDGRPNEDGLARPWRGKVFMNPPYGRGIGQWAAKAVQEVMAARARTVVALLPARTDTIWWQATVMQRLYRHHLALRDVRFVRGRLTFGGAKSPAPFPSVIVVWGS